MKPIYSVAELVPHSATMSLLSAIIDYGDDWLLAEVQITADSTFAESHGVPAWIGLEYMAQAAAAYSGLQQRQQDATARFGLLLGTRKYTCNTDHFALGLTLVLDVHLAMRSDNGLNVFNCELRSRGVMASATVNVFLTDDDAIFSKDAMS